MHSPHGTGYTVVGTHKGSIGGLQRMTYSYIAFAICVFKAQDKTQESNYVAWKSNIQYLCSGLKWIYTNTSGTNIHIVAFTQYPFSTSLWRHTHRKMYVLSFACKNIVV